MGPVSPTIFPLIINSAPIQAWESRDMTAAQISLAKHRAPTGTGAVRKLFQLWSVCSSRHCQAQNTPKRAGRKNMEENRVCWLHRLYHSLCSSPRFPR